MKEIVIEGQTYRLGVVTVGVLKAIQASAESGFNFNCALVEASLRAAGDPTPVGEIPFFGVFPVVLSGALEINGLMLERNGSEYKPGGTSRFCLSDGTFDHAGFCDALAQHFGLSPEEADNMLLTDLDLRIRFADAVLRGDTGKA